MNPPASISDREAFDKLFKEIGCESRFEYWNAALAHRDKQIEGLVEAFEKVITKFSITHLEPDSIAEYRQALSRFESARKT